ncbi:MAG: hypothetical protein IPO67_27995 [Deltaproteobacteria bacterium]|nr:hypothetical protein [Deltaproteobacteria bacterium]
MDQLGVSGRSRVIASDVQEAKAKVERAWKAIRDEGLEDELVPVDLNTALMELGRLGQEIDDLERIVAWARGDVRVCLGAIGGVSSNRRRGGWLVGTPTPDTIHPTGSRRRNQ